jgi:hypothetical protein
MHIQAFDLIKLAAANETYIVSGQHCSQDKHRQQILQSTAVANNISRLCRTRHEIS